MAGLPYIQLAEFLRSLAIPPGDHAALAACVQAAVRQAAAASAEAPPPLEAWLRVPRRLGWLAVAVARQPALQADTRLKVARYALQRARPLADDGTPHGVLALLSCLAGAGALDLATFTRAVKLADMQGSLFDDVTLAELSELSGWLAAEPALDDRQRLWWLWYLVGSCAEAPLGRGWVEAVLQLSSLAPSFKHALCEAWLSNRSPGPLPAAWQRLDQALTAELGVVDPFADPADETDEPDGAQSDLLGIGPDDGEAAAAGDEDDVLAALGAASHLMRSALGVYLTVPDFVRRRAVLGLAQFGGDPLAVCERCLAAGGQDATGALGQGAADVLRHFRDALPPERVRALLALGRALPQASARQAFLALDGPEA